MFSEFVQIVFSLRVLHCTLVFLILYYFTVFENQISSTHFHAKSKKGSYGDQLFINFRFSKIYIQSRFIRYAENTIDTIYNCKKVFYRQQVLT